MDPLQKKKRKKREKKIITCLKVLLKENTSVLSTIRQSEHISYS